MVSLVPTIIERWNQGAAVGYDIFSRLLKDRIIFVGGYEGTVTTDSANLIIAQLLFLEAEDPDKEINLYINSPGGMVTAAVISAQILRRTGRPRWIPVTGLSCSALALLLLGIVPDHIRHCGPWLG